MYIDLIILLVIIILVMIFFKKFYSVIFTIASIDIFLRIMTFIKYNCGVKDIRKIINRYLPESIINIIDKYTKDIDILNITLKWLFVVLMIIFLFYIIKILVKNKKI